jgi:hypothetical protein
MESLAPGHGGDQAMGSSGVDYAPPVNSDLPLPLYSTNPAAGGFFLDGGYVMWRQPNLLKDQLVAVRGFTLTDSTISTGLTALSVVGLPNGTFEGDRTQALNVHQVSGPTTYQPGFHIGGGWRFGDGSALTFDWTYVAEAKYSATADGASSRPFQDFGPQLESSFLSSFVFNFPTQFAGPPGKIVIHNPAVPAIPPFITAFGAVYGIWNGAQTMTESFVQRTQQIEATYRMPFYQTECYRISGLVGPRFFWIWEKYQWTTTDNGITTIGTVQVDQGTQPDWVGIYQNIISNRMYGIHCGCSQEWYIGKGFAAMLDLQVAGFLDVVRERAQYSNAVRDGIERRRTVTTYTMVPEFQATPYIMWYPWEGVQLRFGWDFFCFFNTVYSPRPIDFNYSSVDPNYERAFRFFDGLQASIAFVF